MYAERQAQAIRYQLFGFWQRATLAPFTPFFDAISAPSRRWVILWAPHHARNATAAGPPASFARFLRIENYFTKATWYRRASAITSPIFHDDISLCLAIAAQFRRHDAAGRPVRGRRITASSAERILRAGAHGKPANYSLSHFTTCYYCFSPAEIDASTTLPLFRRAAFQIHFTVGLRAGPARKWPAGRASISPRRRSPPRGPRRSPDS